MRATIFAVRDLRIPDSEAPMLAADAVTFIWEECKFGRAAVEDEASFWALVSAHLYKIRHNWRVREYSLDAPIPNSEGEADGHEAGWNGYMPADQFYVTYLNQVRDGIKLLPAKHRRVMRALSEGHNAIDISEDMRLPVHTVFRLIAEARRFLWDRELVAIAGDHRRA